MTQQTDGNNQVPVAPVTPAALQFNLAAARQHIEGITGSPDTPMIFQTFSESAEALLRVKEATTHSKQRAEEAATKAGTKPKPTRRIDPLTKQLYGTVDQHAEALKKLNQQGAGIFICVNEIPITTDSPSPKRTAKNVTAVRSLYIDYDGKVDGEEATPAERFAWLRDTIADWVAIKCVPQVLTESSERKYHAYYRVEDCATEEFKPLQKALIERFGTDPAVHDLPRVMRLAGFNAQKGAAAPRVVNIILPRPGKGFTKVLPVSEIIERCGLSVGDEAAASASVDDMFAGDGGWGNLGPQRRRITREDTASLAEVKSVLTYLSKAELGKTHWCADRENWLTIAFGLDFACDDIDLKVELLAEFSTTYDSEEQAYRPRESDPAAHQHVLEGKRAEAQEWFAKQAGTERDGPQSGMTKIFTTALELGWVYLLPTKKKTAISVAASVKENVDMLSALESEVMLRHDLKFAELCMFPTQRRKSEKAQKKTFALTIENLDYYLDKYGAKIAYNVITNEIDTNIGGCGATEGRRVMDAVVGRLNSNLADHGLSNLQQLKVFTSIVATQRKVNPVTGYLDSLPAWDGVPRFNQVADLIDSDNRTVLEAMLRIFFVGSVAAADHAERSPNPRKISKFETMLIFQGGQGLNKNKFLKFIVPPALREFQSDGVKLAFNDKDKDTLLKALKYWICDCSELGGTLKRSTMDDIKAFLSLEQDEIRAPYGTGALVAPRRTLFTATVNDEAPLIDSTGSRRFPTVGILSAIDIDKVTALDLDQIWREAWERYLGGELWWMTPEEESVVFDHQENFDSSGDSHLLESESLDTFYDWSVMPNVMPDGWWITGSAGQAAWLGAGGQVLRVTDIIKDLTRPGDAPNIHGSTVSMGKALSKLNRPGRTGKPRKKRDNGGWWWAMPPRRGATEEKAAAAKPSAQNVELLRARVTSHEQQGRELRRKFDEMNAALGATK